MRTKSFPYIQMIQTLWGLTGIGGREGRWGGGRGAAADTRQVEREPLQTDGLSQERALIRRGHHKSELLRGFHLCPGLSHWVPLLSLLPSDVPERDVFYFVKMDDSGKSFALNREQPTARFPVSMKAEVCWLRAVHCGGQR